MHYKFEVKYRKLVFKVDSKPVLSGRSWRETKGSGKWQVAHIKTTKPVIAFELCAGYAPRSPSAIFANPGSIK
jgi:hypothetical protein